MYNILSEGILYFHKVKVVFAGIMCFGFYFLFQKADKTVLDGKVNYNVFDSTCNELSKMINDMLEKLGTYVSDIFTAS